ncbi:MAG: hypothetical protein NXI04_13940 [Planctomycetaceae bacterium]|nr:hypothetical protein [Planctomycetaceae bacterium]
MAEISEIHELLESVRVTLSSSMNPNREELDRLHSELDGEIRLANKRLRECDALLAEGHRSEAIQLAEQEPNLLEVVSILDFPELPEWNDFVAELGLTVTPELQIDIATDINSAYSEDEPLERLLRKFRVLSLARAPLRSRIDLLRQIAKRDPGTAYWKDDLRSYEEVRIRQIADESRAAVSSRDVSRIRTISEELHKKPWSVKPDRRVMEKIDTAMAEIKKLDATRQLQKLTAQLKDATEADDAELARDLEERWQQLAAKCDQSSEMFQDTKDDAAVLFRWIRQADSQDAEDARHAAEVKKLSKVLRSDRSKLEDIYRQYDIVAEFSQGIPEAVQERYEARIQDIERAQKMKKMGVMGAVALAVILVLVVAGSLIFR